MLDTILKVLKDLILAVTMYKSGSNSEKLKNTKRTNKTLDEYRKIDNMDCGKDVYEKDNW